MDSIENKTLDEAARTFDLEIEDDITLRSYEGGEQTPKKVTQKKKKL